MLLALVFGLVVRLEAHLQTGQAAGLLTGLKHPISGPEHALAMIAVGLWGAQLGSPAAWMLPVAFPMMMAFGGFIGLVGLPLPGVEIGIALSAILLASPWRRRAGRASRVAIPLVAFFAIFHGHAHGTELPKGRAGSPIASGL